MASKNECGKIRTIENPYEVWSNGSVTWYVLKKYQAPEKENANGFARWYCAVTNPYGSFDYGDVYVDNIVKNAKRVDADGTEQIKARKQFGADPLAFLFG